MASKFTRRAIGVGSSRATSDLCEPQQADAPRARLLEHFRFFEDDYFSRLERGGAEMRVAHRLQRAQPKAGNVEAPVLPRLHRFHEQGAVGLERAGPPQHFVGAFEGFDCEHGSLSHDAALTDVEPGTFTRDLYSVIDIFLLDGKFPARHASRRCKLLVEKGARIEQCDAEILNLARDRAEDRF